MRLRIAQVAPLFESVPPRYYGGTERVAHFLTEGLVKRGHKVTLFASGDSQTSADLCPCSPKALRLDPSVSEPLAYHVSMMEKVLERESEFDLIHFHCDFLQFPLAKLLSRPYLSTYHGRMDPPEVSNLLISHPEHPVVSISNNQRLGTARDNWQETIYHGLPLDLYRPKFRPENYFAFLGRVSPEKGLPDAIQICKALGAKLKIAAKIDAKDAQYFESEVRPLLNDPLIEFVGEIGESQKEDFLGNALALLFPIRWPEPFGMVMIESMACGAPIIAFDQGSVPEVIDDGVSGFIVNSVEEAIKACRLIKRLDRRGVRARFEERFSQEVMVGNYEKVYVKLLMGHFYQNYLSERPVYGRGI